MGTRRIDRNGRRALHGARDRMVERHIAARGVRSEAVLDAMRTVPREAFLPPELRPYAYEDRPLPIAENQTISQPFIVALMAEAAGLRPDDTVLEVGTGSGYAAAVFSRAAAEVFTVERHATLAEEARERFEELGYGNIEVAVRDGTLGWPEHAPYDAIIVAAGGPGRIPPPLLEQLAPGGRLVIPRGETLEGQELVRVRRSEDGRSLTEEALGAVRFVPLVGAAGWTPEGRAAEYDGVPAASGASASSPARERARTTTATRPATVPEAIAASAEPFDSIDSADLGPLLDRIGGARLVLIGEASHGTSEFYRMRARITRELIEKRGFDFVAVEADWPDAAEVDAYVRHDPRNRPHRKPFQRFPRWMWANAEVMEFVHWLRDRNGPAEAGRRVGFHGLDLYSMHASIEAVLDYLDDIDPEAAAVARDRYGCLTPWQSDPVLYGRAVLTGTFDECEEDVVRMLNDLMAKRLEYVRRDGARFVDAIQNARLVASAEKYYRIMYRGSVSSWNLRDQHMFDTLRMLLDTYGPSSRGVVWAHNSHLGDASATAMGERGEHNVGQLTRQAFGDQARLVGFGTHTGTVAAAHDWGEPMQVMEVNPSHPLSYERLGHDSAVPRFVLPLRDADPDLRQRLLEERLERAIGVIYRPRTELQSHYFNASLPRQFDEWIWLDETSAVTPIGEEHRAEIEGLPETFPFGL
ncbi:MAG: protein-L-isoaspartate(D-aspartate) O-methyltransferase [Gemmatimonadetes bacterium]|nr:protein-L-isoaspartate(D-aspartate) O-methyltransferase [Gemmatimonadota bacterium]